MVRTPHIFLAALAGVIATVAAIGGSPRADEQRTQAPQEVATPLLKAPLAGVADKEVNILHVSVDPGFTTARHYHPGQLFIYVLEGTVTIEVDGMSPVKLGPGDVFEEPPGRPMVGKNLSATHGAQLVVFQIGDKGEPFTVETE